MAETMLFRFCISATVKNLFHTPFTKKFFKVYQPVSLWLTIHLGMVAHTQNFRLLGSVTGVRARETLLIFAKYILHSE